MLSLDRCSATTSSSILPVDPTRPRQRHGDASTTSLELLVLSGPLAAARDPDDDPGAVAEPRVAWIRRSRAFYEYHSSLMEPWDGPASIAFTDGSRDRRGPRPQRPASVALLRDQGRPRHHGERSRRARRPAREHRRLKDRLQPGKIFLVDTVQGRGSSTTRRSRAELAARTPYQQWLAEHLDRHRGPARRRAPARAGSSRRECCSAQQAFGYTRGRPAHPAWRLMARTRRRGAGLDGHRHRRWRCCPTSRALLFDYFKQLFAQVTNPPLDAIREELITSMASTIGPEGNLLDPRPESCRQIAVKNPVISNEELGKLRCVGRELSVGLFLTDSIRATRSSRRARCRAAVPGFRTVTLPMLFDPTEMDAGLAAAMDALSPAGERSGRGGLQHPDPVGSRHQRAEGGGAEPARDGSACTITCVREGTRTQCALVVEAGDAREVHHCALLIGYGAGAVNPYLAFETFDDMIRQGMLPGLTHAKSVRELHQGAQQGHPQGDVQDGHLHARQLLRRADLRSDRPEPGVRRPAISRTRRRASRASASR